MSPAMEPGAGGWGLGLGPKAGTPPPPSWSRFPHSSESPVFFWEGGGQPFLPWDRVLTMELASP